MSANVVECRGVTFDAQHTRTLDRDGDQAVVGLSFVKPGPSMLGMPDGLVEILVPLLDEGETGDDTLLDARLAELHALIWPDDHTDG